MKRWGVRVLFVVVSVCASGLVAPSSWASGPLPPPASGGWSATGAPTKVAIDDLGLFALPGGDALSLGTWGSSFGRLFQAERWSSASGTWSEIARPATRRMNAAMVALPDGRVLIIGGMPTDDAFSYLATTELYDPASGTWSPGPTLAQARRYAAARIVSDRTVLVIGGQSSGATLGTELLDVVAGTSTPVPAPPMSAYFSIVGSGQSIVALSATEAYLFEASTNTWSAIPRPAGEAGESVELPDQRVFVLFKPATGPQVSEIFNSADRTWTTGPGLGDGGGIVKLNALNDGRVLAVRGYEGGAVFAATLDTSALDGWHPVAAPGRTTPSYSAITTLNDGRVLLASSHDGKWASLFDPTVAAQPLVYTLTGDRSSLELDVTLGARFRLKLAEQTTATPLAGIGILGAVVSGPNLGARGCWPTSCVVGSDGAVEFAYAGTGGPGLDTIALTADFDSDGIADDGEPTFSATVQWNRITTYIGGPTFFRGLAQGAPTFGPMKAQLTKLVQGDYGSYSRGLPGRTVRFSVGSGTDCTAVTDELGWATCESATDPVAVALNRGYTASYSGERDYSPSQAKARFVNTLV